VIASKAPFLYIGVRDDRVVRVREILNVAGDDVFDTPLSLVVRGFQKTHGIDMTGVVDEETANALGL
jgi:murein L,D-transpeptidase YcbB/YkuD